MENWETSFFIAEPTANQEVNACAADFLVDNGGVVCELEDDEQFYVLEQWRSNVGKALYPSAISSFN